MELLDYLKIMVQKEASDLYLTTGNAPCIKISGHLFNINNEVLIPGKVKEILYTHINEGQRVNFEQNLELNFGLSAPGVGRFRVNAMMQRSEVAMVLRHNRNKIPTIEDLCLPPILKKIIMEKRGLVLVVGATSSGKSTTLASMIEYRSAHTDGHIICIEDPIEFMHDHHKSIVTQREIGLDTLSYEAALKNALRQAPDVILIGEKGKH